VAPVNGGDPLSPPPKTAKCTNQQREGPESTVAASGELQLALLSAHLGAHFGVISGGGRRISGYFGGASSIKARV
jgi:hypothetical protein